MAREVACACQARKCVIPIRLEDVPLQPELQFFLGALHWLDGLIRPLEPALDALASRVVARLTAGNDEPGEPAEWMPANQQVMADLSRDLSSYRERAFRMQAAMSEPSRVIARVDDAHQIYVDSIRAYNEFGEPFMKRLAAYRAAIRQYWGAKLAAEYNQFHTYLETKVYRGKVFELNDVREALNDLRNRPYATDAEYGETDQWKRPILISLRDELTRLSERADQLLAQLENAI